MCTALISSCKKGFRRDVAVCLFLFWSKSRQTKLGNSIENCYHNGLWMGKTEMLSSLIPWIGNSTFFCNIYHKRTPNASFKALSQWFSHSAAILNRFGNLTKHVCLGPTGSSSDFIGWRRQSEHQWSSKLRVRFQDPAGTAAPRGRRAPQQTERLRHRTGFFLCAARTWCPYALRC